ncbi:TRAP transporter substrate-binding protein [Halorarum halobium]|uniref:TRAP transporter substrate-binding protein n=1 Tax=Halorarum halobium TaxID=3075121 RepID=UPI0028B1601B|nr:TRAP transporter substrate-binding protein DctP [Halobaculum sp. XH14]
MTKHNGITRRRVLGSTAVAGVIGSAGCTGGGSDTAEPTESDTESGGGDGTTTSESGNDYESLPEVTATFASSFQSGSIDNIAIARFKEKIEAETDGRFSVNHVPGGAYGGEVEMTQTAAQGGLEGMGVGPIPIFLYATEHWYTSSPYVMEDYDHLLRVMESDMIQEEVYDKIAAENGLRVMGQPVYVGRRNVTANSAVRTPEDVQGMKLRLPGIDAWVEVWQEIGVNPTSIPGNEIYSGLQTGTADGAAVDANLVESSKLNEVQSHLNLTKQMVGNRNLWINEEFYQGLDPTYQELVIELGFEATAEAAEIGIETEEETINQLESNGMTIVRDVDVEAFKSAATPAINGLFESTWAGTWEEVQQM